MFKKILIANRGEIACRVASTARRMGIKTVAVYSDADAHARHVSMCDEAVHIGGAMPKESYLRMQAVVDACLATGAQAVHPGYGFLSENEDFAALLAKHNIVFIGPPASSIAAMGSKSAAKALMEEAGVPLVPGYHGDNQDPAFLKTQADRIGYPVLIKASAGGGGKGMRIVRSGDEFDAMLTSCKREAINAFGDDKVLVERYLTKPRHIEVQVFADTHGNCVYLFERDCSVQRRHQKVVEEAPAPGMTLERRAAMGKAACDAAKAVGYVGAGTVEFIADEDGTFYFMEMNTRLQVEHPVTEMITRTDLVQWQLMVAAGLPLPMTQEKLKIDGHSMEARIYAENPEKGFLPSIGQLATLNMPCAVQFALNAQHTSALQPEAVRVDSGVRQGDTIEPFYDPMIAKLIVWGESREQAIARMAQALAQTQIVGPATNVAFLGRLMQNTAFVDADLDTGLIEKHHAQLLPAPAMPSAHVLALAVARVLQAEHAHDQNDPWSVRNGWRLNSVYERQLRFASLADESLQATVRISYLHDGLRMTVGERAHNLSYQATSNGLAIHLDGQAFAGNAVIHGEHVHVFLHGAVEKLLLVDPLAHAGEGAAEGGRLTAPMPGKVVAVLVNQGAKVVKGAPLLVMEAMKMEHTITAPADGVVDNVLFAVGDQVTEGAQLVAFAQA